MTALGLSLSATRTVVLLLSLVGLVSTRYPDIRLVSDLAEALAVDQVQFACNQTTDGDTQTIFEFSRLNPRLFLSKDESPKVLLVFPAQGDCLLERTSMGRMEVWLVSRAAVDGIRFRPSVRQEVYVYGESESGSLTLHEIYSVMQGPMKERLLGSWDDRAGLSMSKRNVWDRRRNLGGIKLRNVLDKSGRASFFIYGEDGQIVGTGGYFQDMLRVLENALNFTTVDIPSVEPGKFGAIDPATGEWNGMVGMLVRDEADICTADLSMTLERSKYIDYTLGLSADVITLTVARPNARQVNFLAFFEIFSIYVWIYLFVFLLLLAGGTFLVRYWGRNRFHQPGDPEQFGPLNALAMVAITFIQQDYSFANRRLVASKMLFYASCLFSYLLMTSYVGVLTSFLTVSLPWQPLNSYQDAIDKGYRIYVWDSSSYHEMLMTSREGTALRELYRAVEDNPSSLVHDPEAGVDIVADDHGSAYFGSISYFVGDARILALPDLPGEIQEQLAFGLRKDSELTPVFNFAIQEMYQAGIIKRIEDEWWYDDRFAGGDAASDDSGDDTYKLGFEGLLFPFTVLVVGIVAGVLFGSAEWVRVDGSDKCCRRGGEPWPAGATPTNKRVMRKMMALK